MREVTQQRHSPEELITKQVIDHLEQAVGEIFCACQLKWPATQARRNHVVKLAQRVLKRASELASKIDA